MVTAVRIPVLIAALAAGFTSGPAAAQESKPAETAPAAAGEAIVIKPKFVKGDVHKYTYHLERTDSNTVSGPMAGTSPASTVVCDAEVSLTVKEVTDSGANLELKIEAIKANAKTPAGEWMFDSAKPVDDKDRDNAAFQAFKPLVGMVLGLDVDAHGLVTAVSGEPAVPQGSLTPMATQFFTNIDYIKFRWSNMLAARRDGAASKPGDSWTHTDNFVAANVGRFEQQLKHTLKSVKDGTASIDTAGDMKIYAAKEGAALMFELKNPNILGTATWDVADGLCRSLEMQRAFTLDGSAQGLPVKRESQEKLAITRVK